MGSLSDEQVKAALAAVASPDVSLLDKVDMLVEVAMGLQLRPRVVLDLHHAVSLYDRALVLCPPEERLRSARIQARKGTALNAIPHDGPDYVEQAAQLFAAALQGLQDGGLPEEIAEVELNHGLALQSLASMGRGRVAEAIGAYLRALRVFTREVYPAEYAILHNNLATAYLAMPTSEPSGKLREALAVQSFEEALKVVTLVEQPVEYAMLQNNLGNALQYASSQHRVENNVRALAAYDEALKVRTSRDTPLEYANTISNKANALCNVPDEMSHPAQGNPRNRRQACRYFEEAKEIFARFGDAEKVRLTMEALAELQQTLDGRSEPGTGISGEEAEA